MKCLCDFSRVAVCVREGFIYLLIEYWGLWMGVGCIAELVYVINFGKYVLGDGFNVFVYVASWYEFLVCSDECTCDEVSFLLYIVGGCKVSKFLIYSTCVFSPECLIEIYESFLFLGFLVF